MNATASIEAEGHLPGACDVRVVAALGCSRRRCLRRGPRRADQGYVIDRHRQMLLKLRVKLAEPLRHRVEALGDTWKRHACLELRRGARELAHALAQDLRGATLHELARRERESE